MQSDRGEYILASDYLYLSICTFVIAALLVAFTYAGQQITPLLAEIPGYNSVYPGFNAINPSAISPLQASNSILANYPKFDQYVPIVFIIVSIAILASIVFLPVNGLTIAISFPIMIITVITSFIFSNSARMYFTNPLFANTIGMFPNTMNLMANLGLYELLFLFIYMILLGAKSKIQTPGGGGGGGTASIGFS